MTTQTNWINAYWEAMFNSDFETAIPLKDQHFPKTFFKYKNLSKWTIKSIKENQIHLAEMASLNDPFECTLQFDNDHCLRHFHASAEFQQNFAKLNGPFTSDEIKCLTTDKKPYKAYLKICKKRNISVRSEKDQLEEIQKRFFQMVKEESEAMRVTCFSQTNDELLMWAHYADQHKGICLEYDFLGQDHIRPFLQPVRYSGRIHKIGLFEEMNLINLVCSSLVKSKHWSYEKEWRITSFEQDGIFPTQVNVPDPIAVYLGTRFDDNKPRIKSSLLSLLRRKKIPVFQMTRHPNKYRLISGATIK